MSTYSPIASVTLSSAQSSVTFSGIPQTYTDLVVVINAGNSGGTGYGIALQCNNDTGSNYSFTQLYGTGSAATSTRSTSTTFLAGGFTPSTVGGSTSIIQVMNYSNATTYKTVLARGSEADYRVAAQVGLWRNTSAITSLRITDEGANNFLSGSTFNLYGIANASITNVAKATGGDSVTTDGTYWYHTFRSSGTFTPTQALTADCLVVAGGGGGGSRAGGGGGAGGLLAHTSQSLAATGYTVTVGSGGAGGVSLTGGAGQQGVNGSNSQFGSLTASVGGGGGGALIVGGGKDGGSGGGQGYSTTGAKGLGTSGQGNNGGDAGSSGGSGGGGGASAVGANAPTSSTGGNGGAGSSTYSSWGLATSSGQNVSGTYYYAGGGGGGGDTSSPGSGGNGGGGAGAHSNNNATNATANTGGGGGGARNVSDTTNVLGGAGGSGIVIVRYSV